MTLFRRLCLAFLIAYWAFILTMTHLPPEHLPETGVNDKIEHIGAYGLWASAFFVTLWLYKPRLKNLWLIVLLSGAAYGAFDERTQPFFRRTCDLHDWFADMIGVCVAVTVLTAVRPWIETWIERRRETEEPGASAAPSASGL
jgi:VanZ family protein